jgi:hypothetical protein
MSPRRFAAFLVSANAAVVVLALALSWSGPSQTVVTFGQSPQGTTAGPAVVLLPALLLVLNGAVLIAYRRRRR